MCVCNFDIFSCFDSIFGNSTLGFCNFHVSFRENKKSLFAKTFAKVSCFRHVFFAKTKIEFRENFREKTKTFVPTLAHTVLHGFVTCILSITNPFALLKDNKNTVM
jgi:hypothetical protein